MKAGTVDLLNSERGTLCVVLVIASTILVALAKISPEAWLEYTKWIAVTLVAGKTITSALETMTSAKTDQAVLVATLPTATVVCTRCARDIESTTKGPTP